MATHKVTTNDGWEGIVLALNNTEDGDTVLLESGIYEGDKCLNVNRNIRLLGGCPRTATSKKLAQYTVVGNNKKHNILCSHSVTC